MHQADQVTELMTLPGEAEATGYTSDCNCYGGVDYPNFCATSIKGNVAFNSGKHMYHMPYQEYYNASPSILLYTVCMVPDSVGLEQSGTEGLILDLALPLDRLVQYDGTAAVGAAMSQSPKLLCLP